MGRRLIATLLGTLLVTSPAMAGDLSEGIARAARNAAAAQGRPAARGENRYLVPGLTLLAVGGGVLLFGAMHETGVTCTSTLLTASCDTTKSAGTMIAGAAIAGVGGILLMKGQNSPELVVSHVGGISIRQRISWK